MLSCKSCVKRDVCKNMEAVNACWERLSTNIEFQTINNRGINIQATCTKFVPEQKIIRGGL